MAYLHPGVYIEEIPSGSKPIEAVGTSTAAFIGYTTKGPIGEPTVIQKWDDYDKQFGPIRDTQATEGDPMGFSVLAYFQNGGSKAYIVRVTKDWNKDDAPIAFDAAKATAQIDDPSKTGAHRLTFTAVNEGTWANGLVIQISVSDIQDASSNPAEPLYNIEIGRNNRDDEFEPIESFSNVSLNTTKALHIKNVINGVSQLVTVEQEAAAEADIDEDSLLGTLISGDLTGVSTDFSGVANAVDRTLSVTLDGQTPFAIEIPQSDFATLADLAAKIQELVRGGASVTVPRRKDFTCVVDGNKLILTSGTRTVGSLVTIASATMATTLKLLPTDGAELHTGQESYDKWEERDATMAGGLNGSKPLTDDYVDVFTKFLKIRDINTICLPGQKWANDGSGNPVIDAAIGHASKMKNRMVIVDPPSGHELVSQKKATDLKLPSKTYSVLYYPWIKVSNPFYNAETNPGASKTVLVPPSGFAAGMWANIDAKRGVWKAPAGLEASLLGVAGLEYVVENGEQDALNPLGVNCLRAMPGAGNVIWGSRTLATKSEPEWRYVPVRRTAILIEQSIYEGIQWAVFEPNDHRLWSALRANIGNFMNGLFRAGAFQGEKASDAYFVRCNLGDTMTQGDIDAGQVIVVVGFAPLKPAEFVIVRIQQKVNQQ